MIEANIPQDILKYKTKFIANFSVRETIFLAAGAIAGVSSYITFLSEMPKDVRMYGAAGIAIFLFMFGFCKPFGLPLEKAIFIIIMDNFIYPPKRYKDVKFSEYEKYRKGLIDADGKSIGKNKGTKAVKVKASKEYKAIR